MVKRFDMGPGFVAGFLGMVVSLVILQLIMGRMLDCAVLAFPVLYLVIWFMVGTTANSGKTKAPAAAFAAFMGAQGTTGAPIVSAVSAACAWQAEHSYRRSIGEIE